MDRIVSFLMVGLGGGFTTFSTFSMQNVRMLQEGRMGSALIYILATVIVCIAMAWLGYRLSQSR